MEKDEIIHVTAKIDTFHKDGKFSCRICFLYDDRSPEILEKHNFNSELEAFLFGKAAVNDVCKSIPGSTIEEIKNNVLQ